MQRLQQMAESPSTSSPADRNLLFGVLAFHSGFVSREQLRAAAQAWSSDQRKSLGEILVEQKLLSVDVRGNIESLVGAHVVQHDGDVHKSLAALGPVEEFASLFAPDAGPMETMAFWTPANGSAVKQAVSSTPPIPTHVSRFHILRPHARGGLGEVFIARDEELNREVALKEIQPQFASQSEYWSRFVLEAEITGSLEHPGIVPVYGLGSYPDGRPYYAMRFIQGDSLQEAICRFHDKDTGWRDQRERSLALRELLGRFVDVCQAIAYAHSRGVLHRDLKPGNVMLGKYGETLVVDWGLAKSLTTFTGTEPAAVSGSGPTQANVPEAAPTLAPQALANSTPAALAETGIFPAPVFEKPLTPRVSTSGAMATQMGQALGTPAYMSPEQAAGQLDKLAPPSDVYSLGATLYHLLTGRPPFQERDLTALLNHVQRGKFPRPRAIKSTVAPGLEAICLKAMALRPDDRYASALDLASEVERWLADEPVNAYREPWTMRTRRWLGRHRVATTSAAVAAVMAIAGLGIVLLVTKASAERERSLREEETAAKVQATQNLDLARAAEIKEIHQQKLAQARLEKGVEAVERMVSRVTGEKWAYRPELETERREVLEEAILFFKQLGAEGSQEPTVRRLAARAYLQSGNVQIALGDYEKSASATNTALELYQGLVKQFPNDLLAREGQINALILLGGLDSLSSKYLIALPRFEKALKLADETLRLHPDAEGALLAQTEVLVSLARYHTILDPAKSQRFYNQALTVSEKLLARPNPSYRARLQAAVCLVNRGVGESNQGQYQRANASFERARVILAPTEHMPAPNSHTAAMMSQTQASIDVARGLYLCRQGKKEEGLAVVKQGIDRLRRLRSLIPRSFPYQFQTMQHLIAYALELTRQGKGDEAQPVFREADQIRDKLLAEVPQMTWLISFGDTQKVELLIWKIQNGRSDSAEKEMDELVKRADPRSRNAMQYNCACLYSRLAEYGPKADRERFALQAVEILNTLLDTSYFALELNRTHLDNDPDLVALHKRPDYQAFLKKARAVHSKK
jgi:eukaryotic-like serine/threonine-protein kinase